MSERDFAEILPALITTTCLLCCCCLVIVGGGAGAFFYMRRNQSPARPAAGESAIPTMTYSPGPEQPPAAETVVGQVPSPFAAPAEAPPPAEPAGPIDPEDIRARLLDLNGPDLPYVVQATGYKIAIAPTDVTGYLLEISFDYVEKVARFVETNVAYAVPRMKADARQVLEAHGWTIRE
jgi:hypothetical protein